MRKNNILWFLIWISREGVMEIIGRKEILESRKRKLVLDF